VTGGQKDVRCQLNETDLQYLNVTFNQLNNVIHHQVIEREKQQKTIYNKHQNTIDMLDYQAITPVLFTK